MTSIRGGVRFKLDENEYLPFIYEIGGKYE